MATTKPLRWRGQAEATRRRLYDGAAGSSRCVLVERCALSWLLLRQFFLLLTFCRGRAASLHPYPPPYCSSGEVWAEELHSVALPWGWAACPLGCTPCWVSKSCSTPAHPSSPLPSPASLPLSLSCLSCYPFLNYCLHCVLKMQCDV